MKAAAVATVSASARDPRAEYERRLHRVVAHIAGWLPASGLQVDARPLLEHYPPDARFDAATGVFDCQLCVPVKPL